MGDFRRVRCGAWVLKHRKNTSCFMYVTMSRKLPRRELFFDTSQREPEVLGGMRGAGVGGGGGMGILNGFLSYPAPGLDFPALARRAFSG